MKPIFVMLLILCCTAVISADVITRFGFEFSDDLPILIDGDGMPSARHTGHPIGSTESAQGYYEYLPQGYETDNQDYPLLVFIHGLGENGNGDSQLDDLLATGIPKIIDDDEWDENWPFLVLSPQNSSGGCTGSNQIFNFINFAKENYRVNPSRVYLTGLSCGAIGSWNYLRYHTNEQIAAVVPIAGNGTGAFNGAGCELNRVPIWAFHGDNDGTVDVSGTTYPINNLLACTDPEPLDTSMIIYPGVSHNSWQRTYDLNHSQSDGHDIYQWFLSKKNLDIVVPIELAVNRSVSVDVGASSGSTTNPWNNLTNINGSTGQLMDDQASFTTVQMTITDGFNGTNQNGIGTNAFGVPETVTADNFWVGSFDGHAEALLESAVVSISGLDQTAVYRLELYASRSGNDGGNGRLTRYEINGLTQDLEVSDNTTESIVFDNISGTEVVDLSVRVSPDGTGRFAYLGGIQLLRTD
jgi:predicted esterase